MGQLWSIGKWRPEQSSLNTHKEVIFNHALTLFNTAIIAEQLELSIFHDSIVFNRAIGIYARFTFNNCFVMVQLTFPEHVVKTNWDVITCMLFFFSALVINPPSLDNLSTPCSNQPLKLTFLLIRHHKYNLDQYIYVKTIINDHYSW